jgi:hypothetical protein
MNVNAYIRKNGIQNYVETDKILKWWQNVCEAKTEADMEESLTCMYDFLYAETEMVPDGRSKVAKFIDYIINTWIEE